MYHSIFDIFLKCSALMAYVKVMTHGGHANFEPGATLKRVFINLCMAAMSTGVLIGIQFFEKFLMRAMLGSSL